MITREQIVEEARRWLGTPYQHKGRVLGRAADCAAVVVCVAHTLGLEYEEHLDYGRVPNPRRMMEELDKYLIRIRAIEAQPADVYFMAWKKRPHHLALKTDVGILHAYNLVKPPRVVEHTLSPDWLARIKTAYRFPGVV